MPQLSIAQLFDDNRAELRFTWTQGDRDHSPTLDSQRPEVNHYS